MRQVIRQVSCKSYRAVHGGLSLIVRISNNSYSTVHGVSAQAIDGDAYAETKKSDVRRESDAGKFSFF
jgi:hypothetical protein